MGSSLKNSVFDNAVPISPDAIFDVTRRYFADQHLNKVNLGQGTYRDENGEPWVLPSVRMAQSKIGDCGHEYLPISGLKEFRDEAVKICFGGTEALSDDRVSDKDQNDLGNTNTILDCIVPVAVGDRCAASCRACSEKSRSGDRDHLHHGSDLV